MERVEWLEGPHEPKKYTIEDAKEIKKLYKQKLKLLRGQDEEANTRTSIHGPEYTGRFQEDI